MCPDLALHVLKIVEGDISLNKLGLSPEASAVVEAEANVIIHCAATVNFDETIKLAVQLNTLGARRVLDLAKNCKNLYSHVHVSTAYVNCIHNSGNIEIREKIYPLSYVSEAPRTVSLPSQYPNISFAWSQCGKQNEPI